MKTKIISIFMLSLCATVFVACDDNDTEKYFPQEYHQIISIKGDNTKDLNLNTTQGVISDEIVVLRGGAMPNKHIAFNLNVMTKEEVCEAWNLEAEAFEIIPAESYSISQKDGIELGAEESYKILPVSYDALKLYKAIKSNKAVTWVLPLCIETDQCTTNKDKNRILVRISVESPYIEWQTDQKAYTIKDENLTVDFSAVMKNDVSGRGEIKYSFDAINAEALVAEYNKANDTKYDVLPAAAYTITPMTFASGSTKATSEISITRNALTPDHEYLLPVMVSSVSNEAFDKPETPMYIIVKYIGESKNPNLQENAGGTISQGTQGNNGATIGNSTEVLSKGSNFK